MQSLFEPHGVIPAFFKVFFVNLAPAVLVYMSPMEHQRRELAICIGNAVQYANVKILLQLRSGRAQVVKPHSRQSLTPRRRHSDQAEELLYIPSDKSIQTCNSV